MKIRRFYWKEHLREKIECIHGVTVEEVEEVFESRYLEKKCGKNRHKILGQTRGSRLLFVIIDDEIVEDIEDEEEVQVPVTARDMTKTEKQTFKKGKL